MPFETSSSSTPSGTAPYKHDFVIADFVDAATLHPTLDVSLTGGRDALPALGVATHGKGVTSIVTVWTVDDLSGVPIETNYVPHRTTSGDQILLIDAGTAFDGFLEVRY